MKKIQNNMHTLGERIQEYGVRNSSFYLFQLNTSTSQHLNILVFPYSHGATTWHGGLSCKLQQDCSLRRKMKKIQNNMHTLGERIQEYGVRNSSFIFI